MMSPNEIDLNPVTHLTTDSIGKPGQRVFYIQGYKDEKIISLLVEKVQIQTLAMGVEQFLSEINERYPDLAAASDDYDEEKMHISPPVDPLFRVGELGLGYDDATDQIVLIAREILLDNMQTEDARVVRFWCTRSQVRAMARWGLEVSGRGRPICPYCGQPEEPEGHFCSKKNGHKH